MEAGVRRAGGAGWRLWALAPIAAARRGRSASWSTGSSLARTDRPRPAARRPVRRAPGRVQAGEIRIRVTNPQREDLTIASVTVDDAIVPFTLDGPASSAGCARARSWCLTTGRGRPVRGRRDELDRDRDGGGDRRPRSRRAGRRARRSSATPSIGLSGRRGPRGASASLWLPALRRRRRPRCWLLRFMALTGGLLTFPGGSTRSGTRRFELPGRRADRWRGGWCSGSVALRPGCCGGLASYSARTFVAAAGPARGRRRRALAAWRWPPLVAGGHRAATPRRRPGDRLPRSALGELAPGARRLPDRGFMGAQRHGGGLGQPSARIAEGGRPVSPAGLRPLGDGSRGAPADTPPPARGSAASSRRGAWRLFFSIAVARAAGGGEWGPTSRAAPAGSAPAVLSALPRGIAVSTSPPESPARE
jgi:hypothetical protein